MFEQLPLRDIHLPEPVSWWPPAPGWWLLPVVAVLACLVLRLVAKRARRNAGRRRLRRQALAELDRIERRHAETGDGGQAAQGVSILLRRVAVTLFPDGRVAGLAGRDWVDWIRRTGPRGLDEAPVAALRDAPYRPTPGAAVPGLLDTARRWVRHVTASTDPLS